MFVDRLSGEDWVGRTGVASRGDVRDALGSEPGRGALVVGPDGATCRVLGWMLGNWGWSVETATTVPVALGLLEGEPGVIVLDMGLPGCEGVLGRVRDEGRAGRVVVIAGALDAGRHRRVAAWRPDRILSKPLDVARLLTACNGPA